MARGHIIDDAERFGYVDEDGRDVTIFDKVNPFASTPETVTVDLGDGVIRERPTAGLEKRTGMERDDANETTYAVEYWLDGVRVHRSALINLKQASVLTSGIAANLG